MRFVHSGVLQADRSGELAMPSAPSRSEVEAQDEAVHTPYETPVQVGESAHVSESRRASYVLDLMVENDEGIWTTVVRRRGRKEATTPLTRRNVSRKDPDLTRTLSEAERSLTAEDKLRIRKRSEVEASASRAETESSQEEELVDRKGKGPDPSNWGQLNVHGDDLDINAQ